MTLALSISVLAVLALMVFVTRPRRRRPELSRDTLRADRSVSSFLDQRLALAGHDFERAAKQPATPSSPVVLSADGLMRGGPPDPDQLGVTRRQFFNRSITGMLGLSLSGFGGSVLAFLWPRPSAGFGSKISVGALDDILASIQDSRAPVYNPQGRFYLNPYPPAALAKAEKVYGAAVLAGLRAGIVAQYQKCPHLGCRVPWCATSQWFECPCHGSQYNRVGEKKGGPAPRGLDLFPVDVAGGRVTVDTGIIVLGAAIGTNTTGQEAEGPHCVTGARE